MSLSFGSHNNNKLALRILSKKCQAKLSLKFKVAESHGFLLFCHFSNGKNRREVTTQTTPGVQLEALLQGFQSASVLCLAPVTLGPLPGWCSSKFLLQEENQGREDLSGWVKTKQLLAELGKETDFLT